MRRTSKRGENVGSCTNSFVGKLERGRPRSLISALQEEVGGRQAPERSEAFQVQQEVRTPISRHVGTQGAEDQVEIQLPGLEDRGSRRPRDEAESLVARTPLIGIDGAKIDPILADREVH